MLPPFVDVFIAPVRDSQAAQIATIALMVLTLVDILFGVFNAILVHQNFSSHELRKGLIRKLGNFGMLLVADVIDALLLGGLNIGIQPIYIVLVTAFCLMEIGSVIELWADAHPEYRGTGIWKILENAKGKGRDEDA